MGWQREKGEGKRDQQGWSWRTPTNNTEKGKRYNVTTFGLPPRPQDWGVSDTEAETDNANQGKEPGTKKIKKMRKETKRCWNSEGQKGKKEEHRSKDPTTRDVVFDGLAQPLPAP